MNIMCPNGCSEYLKVEETDSRQEWYSELMICINCKKEFEHRVDFELQSNKIEKEVLIDDLGNEIDF